MKKEIVDYRDFEKLEEDVYIKLERLKKILTNRLRENRNVLESLEIEIDTIKRDIDEFKKVVEKLKDVRFESLNREMESMKTKWKTWLRYLKHLLLL